MFISAKPNHTLRVLSSLPPFPPVAAKLMSLLRQENADFKQAVELMKTDAGITLEVLRLANSASSGSKYPTTSLLQAMSVLGVNRIVSLTTTLCLGRMLKAVSKLPVMRRCWQHNLATAIIASKRSAKHGLDPEKAYTFGLLAGLGRMALLVSNPNLFEHAVTRAEKEHMPLAMLEQELFGFDHQQAGSWLIMEWKLPAELQEVLFSTRPMDGARAELAEVIREAAEEADHLGFSVLNNATADNQQDPDFFDIAERLNQIEQELAI